MSAEEDRLRRLQLVLDELAEQDAAELVREARIEARSRVRGLLAEALAERLLERAERELDTPVDRPVGGRAREERPPDRSPAHASPHPRETVPRETVPRETVAPAVAVSGDQALGWYVYGVAHGGYRPPPLPGVFPDEPVSAVGEGELAAVVSRVPLSEYGEEPLRERLADVHWLEPNARRHEHVLEQLRADGADVVPMRLCTIYRNRESVHDALAREREFLLDALARLAGRSEWGVKAFLVAGAPAPAEAAREEPAGAEPGHGPGSSYLLGRRQAGRRAQEQERMLAERCEEIHAQLCAAAAEGRLNPLQPPELSGYDAPMLLNGVYLVSDEHAEDFAVAVERLRSEQEAGLELVLTGPWPPYNFVGPAAAEEEA